MGDWWLGSSMVDAAVLAVPVAGWKSQMTTLTGPRHKDRNGKQKDLGFRKAIEQLAKGARCGTWRAVDATGLNFTV